jgi:hypothetical protein
LILALKYLIEDADLIFMLVALHFASGFNRIGVVEHLLRMGASVDAKDKGFLNPLHNAVR